jgi:hypothetical protein
MLTKWWTRTSAHYNSPWSYHKKHGNMLGHFLVYPDTNSPGHQPWYGTTSAHKSTEDKVTWAIVLLVVRDATLCLLYRASVPAQLPVMIDLAFMVAPCEDVCRLCDVAQSKKNTAHNPAYNDDYYHHRLKEVATPSTPYELSPSYSFAVCCLMLLTSSFER